MFWFLKSKTRNLSGVNFGVTKSRQRSDQCAQMGAHLGATDQETIAFLDREVIVRRMPYKRTMGLTMRVNGRIQVNAPKSTPLKRIEDFLRSHTEWIQNNLAHYQKIQSAHPPKRYVEGEKFRYLGDEVALRFEPSDRARISARIEGECLVIAIPRMVWGEFKVHAPHPELRKVVADFFALEGKRVLMARLHHFAEKMALHPSALSFRSQKTRWGSCNSKGKISLNWRLIVAPIAVIDYVVVHELSHLRHYNHSPQFWALVASQIHDFKIQKHWLKSHQYEADFLAKDSELHQS